MRLDRNLLLISLFAVVTSRRVRVQPVEYEDDAYYADPQDDSSSRAVVLVGDDGYYRPQSRGGQDNYIPVTHRAPAASRTTQYAKEARTQKDRAPPVQTIRNYNKVNDDGSFTFGYEAADGSFKEETRGTDCVVRGKYGYVDPDGNKREFTYVSGNPCDPNAAKDEDESREINQEDSAEPENVPQNYPTRPIRPLRPVVTTTEAPIERRPPIYQQYIREEEEEEPEQVLRVQPQPVRHRPTYVSSASPTTTPRSYSSYSSNPSTTESDEDSPHPLTITPRPLAVTSHRPQPPATTYRPQLLQVAVTPRPALVYSTKQVTVQPQEIKDHQRPGTAARDFVAEYQKYQSTTERNTPKSTPPAGTQHSSNPVYSSELVFDPASGQYKTALYQTLPQTEGDFTLNHRIQPYVHQPQPQLVNFRQLQQQSPLYRPVSPAPTRASNQAAYQAQQAEIQFQNSQQLFAQQQRARAQQNHQPPQRQPQQVRPEPQQFYYIQPQALQGVANGQIEAFLRGHNIQY